MGRGGSDRRRRIADQVTIGCTPVGVLLAAMAVVLAAISVWVVLVGPPEALRTLSTLWDSVRRWWRLAASVRLAAAVLLAVAIFLLLVRQRLWRLVKRFGYNLRRGLGWAARHWELTVAVILLFLVTVGAYAYARTFWAVMLVLGCVVAIVLLARYEHVTMIFSGEMGEFADPNGPWTPSVACEHFPDWPRMPPAKWLWIRDKPTDEEAGEGQEVRHRRKFWLLRDRETLRVAKLRLRVDDVADVFVNNEHLGEFRGYGELHEVDIANRLRRGKNELMMQILNDDIAGSTGGSNPSGVVYIVEIR